MNIGDIVWAYCLNWGDSVCVGSAEIVEISKEEYEPDKFFVKHKSGSRRIFTGYKFVRTTQPETSSAWNTGIYIISADDEDLTFGPIPSTYFYESKNEALDAARWEVFDTEFEMMLKLETYKKHGPKLLEQIQKLRDEQ